ncbi:glycosyltransferase [Solimonas terrae]|uniref:Glycosyltransferase n=1 Tax=Solimonas terrae TaxID=1396819 RepID=A0A6M2BV44_9GAMM|nr:glycosyltransferase [Solimonas terrae]NGY05993.1 glycosyltransferase [Solimonas terrae]
MHIHYLINGLNGGGAAFPIPDLVARMRARGHSVRVLALSLQDGKSCARLDRAGIEWQVLGRTRNDWIGAARALFAEIRRDRPDLIWTSLTGGTLYGQIAGARFGIPVVSWQHNAYLRAGNRRMLRLTKSLTGLWVADSQSVADFTVQELGVDPARVLQWPIFRARADVAQAAPAAAGARLRIGSLGRLHVNKRYGDLLDAIALLRARDPALFAGLEFVIGGSGDQHEALLARSRRLKLDNVRFAGFIEDTEAFLASLQGYIQTSHHEGMCIAAHEAMQAGVPVIATAVGELQHSVVDGRTGWLCAVGDIDGMSVALQALAQDPLRAAQLGRAGRERLLARFGEQAFAGAGDIVLTRAEALLVNTRG